MRRLALTLILLSSALPPAASAQDPASPPSTDEAPAGDAPDESTPSAVEEPTPVPPPVVMPAPPPAMEGCVQTARARGRDAVVRVRAGNRWGAGFLMRDARTVVTSFRLVREGRAPTIVTRTGQRVGARVVGRDETLELAVLALDEDIPDGVALAVAPVMDAPGAAVFAMGHPFAQQAGFLGPQAVGLLRWSLTVGRVTGLNPRVLQTDLALEDGHVGGPVLDCRGRVVGVVTDQGLLSEQLALIVRTSAVEPLLDDAAADPRGYGGRVRFRNGLGLVALIDENGRSPVGPYLALGGVLFDQLSWITRFGYLQGGRPDASGDEVSVRRELLRGESLVGYRFFVDLGGFGTVHIVPALGVSVSLLRDSQRVVTLTPTPDCTPSAEDACVESAIVRSNTETWNVRPAAGLSFLFGDAFELGYVLEVDTDGDVGDAGRFFHAVRGGFLF